MSSDPYGGDLPGGRQPSGSGARGIFLLAVAVVLGIVLLQAFDTGSGSSGRLTVGDSTTTTEGDTDTSVSGVPGVSTTRGSRAPADVKVLVVNGAGVPGLGAKTVTKLEGVGYTDAEATDATRRLSSSSVQYADGFEAEAHEVARILDVPANAVQPLNSPPVKDVKSSNVVVLVGSDVSSSTTSSTRRGSTTTTRRFSTTTTAP